MDVTAHVSFWSLPFDHWRVSSDCYCAACYGGQFIICSLEIEITSLPCPPSPPILFPSSLSNLSLFVCDLHSAEATINSARGSNISALRRCGGFKSNFVSVPFDDTVVPVIFSYRRMCIWDAKLSLGDVSQSAERTPSGKRCGERTKGQG